LSNPLNTLPFFHILTLLIVSFVLASCGKSYVPSEADPAYQNTHQSHSHAATLKHGGHVKTGNPYQIAGQWYYPLATADGYDKTGVASWYGPNFNGKKTANGERYDMHGMTAAHKTLPMPSMVRVTNLDNGRSVVVRINDRGPFVKSRIIDLSYAAAKALAYDKKGTAHVRVQALHGNSMPTAAQPIQKQPFQPVASLKQSQSGAIYIQLGAFSSHLNAETLRRELSSQFSSIGIYHSNSVDLFRVRIGPFKQISEAEKVISSLQAQGYQHNVVVIQ